MKNFQLIALAAITATGAALGWSADWLTAGVDAQRTHWQKDEKILSPASVKGMKLLWKYNAGSAPRVMSNLHNPMIAAKVTTKSGTKEIALLTTFSDDVICNGPQNLDKKGTPS